MFWILLQIIGCRGGFSTSTSQICPKGLVPIPSKNPVFCIHPYESRITTDQKVESQANRLPSINVSLFDAQEACANTIIDDQSLRLATYREWVDAGDGQLGQGGGLYPWGDSKADDKCIVNPPAQPKKWESVQPSGTLDTCISSFGVYDQIGNAWEWVDLQQNASKNAWVSYIRQQGFEVSASEQQIQLSNRLLPKLRLQTICVDMQGLAVDEGVLTVRLNNPISPDCEQGGRGYLWVNFERRNTQASIPKEDSLLPIRIVDSKVVWDEERDGEPVGAKVGGAFYSGAEMTLQDFWIGHIPTFDGSIGFRCTSDPLSL